MGKGKFKKAIQAGGNALKSGFEAAGNSAVAYREKQKENHKERVADRREFVSGMLNDRRSFKLAKMDERTDRKEIRQENRTERKFYKHDAEKTAYENGIDPKAAWANAASSMVNSASDAAGAAFGLRSGAISDAKDFLSQNPLNSDSPDKAGINPLMILGIIGVLLFMIFGGKRKK